MAAEQLTVTELSKQYPTPGEPLTVVDRVSLSLAAGESLAVTGPSGSGKSTLLYMIGTLESPTSGKIGLGSTDVLALEGDALAAFRNRRLGFIFQDHHLLPQCSALENVLVPAMGGDAPSDAAERARGLLERVGLADRLEHLPGELSGGERQRVAIARALIQSPSLLLADEPTGNLDRRRAEEIAVLLAELQNEFQSILILVTHSSELASRFPHQAELIDGRLEHQ